MEKSIAYSEKDLQNNLDFILSHMHYLDSYIRMMEEQGLGLRDNLDWKSTGKHLRINLEQVKMGLSRFKVRDVPFQDISDYHYDELFLKKVEEQFLDKMGKDIVEGNDLY